MCLKKITNYNKLYVVGSVDVRLDLNQQQNKFSYELEQEISLQFFLIKIKIFQASAQAKKQDIGETSFSRLYTIFLDNVKNNLHIVLAMSPLGIDHLSNYNIKGEVREDTHKKMFFLVVEPLRSGLPPPQTLVVQNIFFFIAWKWSKMDKKQLKISVKIIFEYI